MIVDNIKLIVSKLSVCKFGFTALEIRNRPNRAAAVMIIYLANVSVYMIMIIGRWSYNTFLGYIPKQVQDATSSISVKMLLNVKYLTVTNK